MADLIERASEWLSDRMSAYAARTITYSRPSLAAEVDLLATKARTRFEQEAFEGPIIRSERHDFLVRSADLILDGNQVLPKDGDVIEDDGITYIVTPFDEQTPPWSYVNGFRKRIRIHTIQQAGQSLL